MEHPARARTRAAYFLALLALTSSFRPVPAHGAADVEKPDGKLEVELVSPEDGAAIAQPFVTLQVILRTAPGVSIRLHPLINGQRLPESSRGLVVISEQQLQAQGAAPLEREQLRTLKLPVPPEDCTVSVVAETDFATRTAKSVRLRWQGPERFVVKPKLYFLSIGVSAYRDSGLTLGYAGKDAEDFARAFTEQQGGLYEQVHVQLLLNGQATRDRIYDGLQWLQRQTTAKDVAILFLAGHGIDDPSNGVYYFLPYDADESAAMRSMISQQSLQTVLSSIAGKTLLFLDTCHAASVMNGAKGRAVSDISRLVKELALVDNGLVVYAAASGRQLSQESSRWNNGVFTKAVVEGLRGKAAYHVGRPITVQMLNLYVSERVKELTAGAQTPIMVTTNKLADFPLALAAEKPPMPPGIAGLPPPSLPASQRLAIYRPPWLPPLPSEPTAPPPAPPPRVEAAPPPPPPVVVRPRSEPTVAPSKRPLEPLRQKPPEVPLHRKPWFWLTLGGGVLLVGGLATYFGITASQSGMAMNPSQSPGGDAALTFTKVE